MSSIAIVSWEKSKSGFFGHTLSFLCLSDQIKLMARVIAMNFKIFWAKIQSK